MKTELTIERILSDPDTFECLVLAGLGFSYKLIKEKTGLSFAQIGLRLRKAGLKTRYYRNGETVLANHVQQNAHKFTETVIRKQLTAEPEKPSNKFK